jgi:hypothetical protein
LVGIRRMRWAERSVFGASQDHAAVGSRLFRQFRRGILGTSPVGDSRKLACWGFSVVVAQKGRVLTDPSRFLRRSLWSCYPQSKLLTGAADSLAGYEPCENPCNSREYCKQDLSKTLVCLYEDSRNKRKSRSTEDKSKGSDNH